MSQDGHQMVDPDPVEKPTLSELSEPLAKGIAWGALLLGALALALATARNLLGHD